MKFLLDTHLLLWAASCPQKLPGEAEGIINDPLNKLFFSPASLWEVVIKQGLGRADFQVDAALLRHGLLENGYNELAIGSKHMVAVEPLPPIHKDPFDRILIAQATTEGFTLLTSDAAMARYPGPIRLVK